MGKGALLELHVRMQVNLSCLRRFMAEPKSNYGQVNSASKQRHGRGVAKRMWSNRLRPQRWTRLAGARYVSCDEPLEGIGAELSTA